MKLFDYPKAPNPRRVNLFLREKGIAIPTETIDLMAKQQFSDAYRSVNPQMTVPALQLDDGTVLSQVPAILDYLEGTYPDKPLLGTKPQQRAVIREWTHRIFLEGFSAVGEVLRNGNPAFAGHALAGPVELEQIPALVDRGLKRLPAFFSALDAQLADQEYIAGDAFSMADIDAFVLVGFTGWIKQKVPEDCINVAKWVERVSARPAMQS